MTPGRRIALLFAAATSAVGLLAGCAAGPATVPPTGVDTLRIPTEGPDPADFVAGIDNPWLPLQPGNTWVYRSTGSGPSTVRVTVTDDTREVAGVTTTVVREVVTDAGGEVVVEGVDWFAQDTEGNVWYFGEDTTRYEDGGRTDPAGSWEAGVDGATAGLAMAAEPRVGDGYQQEGAPGVAEDRVEVLALDGSVTVPLDRFTDLLVTEQTSPLEPALVEERYYARGVGLVLEDAVSGGTGRSELVSFTGG